MAQLHLVFNANPERYHPDQAKIPLAASYLRGPAKRWFTPHVDKRTGQCSFQSFESFIAELESGLSGPDAVATAERKLSKFRPRKHSVHNVPRSVRQHHGPSLRCPNGQLKAAMMLTN